MNYHRDLDIRNLENLPRGLGARFLRCLVAHDGVTLIAKQWHRKAPRADTVPGDERIIEFKWPVHGRVDT